MFSKYGLGPMCWWCCWRFRFLVDLRLVLSTMGRGVLQSPTIVLYLLIYLSGLLVFLWHFPNFMLSLVFRSFISMCLGEGFFDLLYLGFTQILESVSLSLFINLGNFQPLFLGVFFQSCHFWNSDDTNVLLKKKKLHRPLRFCSLSLSLFSLTSFSHFSESIFSLMLRLSNFYYSVFQITDSLLCLFHSAAESVRECFISVTELLSSKICFFSLSTYLLKISTFHLFLMYFIIAYWSVLWWINGNRGEDALARPG